MAGFVYLGKSSIHCELASIDAFIVTLNDSNLRIRVRDKEPNNLDHALHIALLAEANTKAKQNNTQEQHIMCGEDYKACVVQNATISSTVASTVSVNSINNRCDKICKMLETIFNSDNADDRTGAVDAAWQTASVPATLPARANVFCFKCGNLGHYATACPEQSSSGTEGDGKGPIRCYSCQDFGHMAQSCPKAEKKEGDATPAKNLCGIRVPAMGQMKDHPVCLKAYMGKRAVNFLVDTGCDCPVTPKKLTGDAFLGPAECILFAANVTVINLVRQVTMNIRIGNLYFLRACNIG